MTLLSVAEVAVSFLTADEVSFSVTIGRFASVDVEVFVSVFFVSPFSVNIDSRFNFVSSRLDVIAERSDA